MATAICSQSASLHMRMRIPKTAFIVQLQHWTRCERKQTNKQTNERMNVCLGLVELHHRSKIFVTTTTSIHRTYISMLKVATRRYTVCVSAVTLQISVACALNAMWSITVAQAVRKSKENFAVILHTACNHISYWQRCTADEKEKKNGNDAERVHKIKTQANTRETETPAANIQHEVHRKSHLCSRHGNYKRHGRTAAI
mmetsp:Transcript_26984/g.75925  ORF Transcript_26984/g.75925 Transcript_26984/m.75925 type:complete len:199 (+) Transcript_26984:2086-2682(+)